MLRHVDGVKLAVPSENHFTMIFNKCGQLVKLLTFSCDYSYKHKAANQFRESILDLSPCFEIRPC